MSDTPTTTDDETALDPDANVLVLNPTTGECTWNYDAAGGETATHLLVTAQSPPRVPAEVQDG